MSTDARIDTLSLKHNTLEQEIEEEMARPVADTIRIAELKKMKLMIKDEIQRITSKAA